MKQYWYSVFGLTVRSEIYLPELRPTACQNAADISIIRSEIKANPPADAKPVQHGRCWGRKILFEHSLAGRMLATEDAVLHVENKPEMPERNMRAFILGPGLAAAMYSTARVPLHVSGLQIAGRVYAFTGPSGAGKSTMALSLNRQYGYRLFTDDVATIRPITGREEDVLLCPGPPRIKLWEDALEQFDISKHGLIRDTTRHNKYHLEIPLGSQAGECQPLAAIVYIRRTAKSAKGPRMKTPKGIERFKMGMNSIYRPELAMVSEDSELLIKAVKNITSRSCFVFESSKSFDHIACEMEFLNDLFLRGTSISRRGEA